LLIIKENLKKRGKELKLDLTIRYHRLDTFYFKKRFGLIFGLGIYLHDITSYNNRASL